MLFTFVFIEKKYQGNEHSRHTQDVFPFATHEVAVRYANSLMELNPNLTVKIFDTPVPDGWFSG